MTPLDSSTPTSRESYYPPAPREAGHLDPAGERGGDDRAPEGARRQGRAQGTASLSFTQAEKREPICADLKPTKGHLVSESESIKGPRQGWGGRAHLPGS